MPTIAIVLCKLKYVLAIALVRIVYLYYPGSLAWDVDNISLVRRVFLVKSIPTSAYTQLNSCISLRQ